MEKKVSQRQRQYDMGRQLFIKTAKELFLTQGYDKTKVSDIASASKKNIATLYHYFPQGKKDIVKALLITDIKEEFEKLEHFITEADNLPLVEALHSFYRRFVDIFYRNWYLMSIILYYREDFEVNLSPITRQGTFHVRQLLAEFLELRVSKREIYITNCTAAANLFFAVGMEKIIVNFSAPEKDIFDTSEIDELIGNWNREIVFFDEPVESLTSGIGEA